MGTLIRPAEIVVSRMPVLYDAPAGAVGAVLRDARAGRSRKRPGRRFFAKLDGAVAPIPTVVPACADTRRIAIARFATRVGILPKRTPERKIIGLRAVRIRSARAGPLVRARGRIGMYKSAVAVVGIALITMQIGCTCCRTCACCRPTRCQSVSRTASSQSDYYTVAERPSSTANDDVDLIAPPLPPPLQLDQVSIPRAPLPWGL